MCLVLLSKKRLSFILANENTTLSLLRSGASLESISVHNICAEDWSMASGLNGLNMTGEAFLHLGRIF